MNYMKKNKIMYYLYIVIIGSFWLILYSEWYRCRETELFVAVTVRLMDWTLVNNSLYLRWLLHLLCSLYSLVIFSIYVCIHIHYNSVENLHWQKLAETCFCRTGLNCGLNHLRQKPAKPAYHSIISPGDWLDFHPVDILYGLNTPLVWNYCHELKVRWASWRIGACFEIKLFDVSSVNTKTCLSLCHSASTDQLQCNSSDGGVCQVDSVFKCF